jgi:hypothetical protein
MLVRPSRIMHYGARSLLRTDLLTASLSALDAGWRRAGAVLVLVVPAWSFLV